MKDLQRAIRKVRAQAEDLVDDSSTYNHFRTALNNLFDKLDQGSEKAAEKALQVAIEEKSRYVAERIARTEAARAVMMLSLPATGRMTALWPTSGSWEPASGRGHLRHVRPCGSVWPGGRSFP